MKKYFFIFLFLVTGCMNYTELNNIAVIKNIGLSYQNGAYQLYVEIIQEVKENKPNTNIIHVTDKNINNLFNKIQSNKELSFAHLDLMIIDENINNQQYNELINYIVKHDEIRSDFFCIYSDNIPKLLENTKFNEMEELIQTNKNINKLLFLDLAKNYLLEKSFTISFITIDQNLYLKDNLLYINNKYERIKNEKEEN